MLVDPVFMRVAGLHVNDTLPPDIVLTIVPDDLTTSLNAPPALRYGAFLCAGTADIPFGADELR